MSLLMPRKVKYRKMQKGRTKGVETRGTNLDFGSHGLKAMEAKWITSRQLEAARRVILRYMKKGGKLWIRVFPYKPVSSHGGEMPMGGGKGGVDHYVYPARAGRIIFEIDGLSDSESKEALHKASNKLPVKTKYIKA